ncbi:hypothetical protein IAT38_006338 [Cryptococcus sp. DSM 104549]
MTHSIPPSDITAVLAHLSLPLPSPPSPPTLPLPPLAFLQTYLSSLPPSLLEPFDAIVPPKERTRIPAVKRRRMLFAAQEPLPRVLRAHEGRLRWPLTWERLGGDPWAEGPAAEEEEEWARDGGFMMPVVGPGATASSTGPGGEVQGGGLAAAESGQKVRKLGGFLRVLEEEREAEGVRAAKRRERARDAEGEEFEDSDSEEEGEEGDGATAAARAAAERPVVSEDQEEVERVFEKRLLELFLDGLDTIDYAPIDFTEPPNGDPIAIRDAEDRYFDDESPSRTPGGSTQGEGRRESVVQGGGDRGMQNGVGEYDY